MLNEIQLRALRRKCYDLFEEIERDYGYERVKVLAEVMYRQGIITEETRNLLLEDVMRESGAEHKTAGLLASCLDKLAEVL